MVGNCKCCCYQEMTFTNDAGAPIGAIKEDCWYCLPSFTIYAEDQTPQYTVKMPSCCGGLCIDLCAEGCCNCKIPFYIYGADNTERGNELCSNTRSDHPQGSKGGQKLAQITKVWAGIGSELCV